MKKGPLISFAFTTAAAVTLALLLGPSRAVDNAAHEDGPDKTSAPRTEQVLSATHRAVTDTADTNITIPPAAEITAPIAQPAKPDTLIFGDSVAKGMKSATGHDGDAVGGRNSKKILAALESFDAARLKGAIVVLTAGTGNARGVVGPAVRQQLEYLRDAGVKNVVLMGVSDKRVDFDPLPTNRELEKLAQEFGFVYGGAVRNAGSDLIHPSGKSEYKKTYQQAISALKAKEKTL